jgi:hypothetical protein
MYKYISDEKILQDIVKGYVYDIKYMKNASLIRRLTEDEVVEFLSNLNAVSAVCAYMEISTFFQYADIRQRAMQVIIDRFPRLLSNKHIKPKITPEIKQLLLDDFCKNPNRYWENLGQCGYIWEIIDMDEDMWKQFFAAIEKPGVINFRGLLKDSLADGTISSELVMEYVIEGSYHHTGFALNAELTKKYFDLWIKENSKYYFSEVLSLSKDRSLALKTYPELYQYIKSPTVKDAEIIVSIDPKNLSFVKKQSEKLCLMALKKDKSVFKYVRKPTKKILAFMGIDAQKAALYEKYPAKQYLITCRKDVADEGDIIYVRVVPGNDMANFMSRKIVRYGFSGNLDCEDGPYYVEDIMEAQAITDDELDVLNKFGMLKLNSGIWNFDDEGDESDD